MAAQRIGFWREAFAIHGSVTPYVLPVVGTFGLIAIAVCGIAWSIEHTYGVRLSLAAAPYEIAGAVLGLLLVLRTNAGYDRWWEARKLWGGIVNQSRNLAISAMAYGPKDAAWQDRFARWVAVFPHAAQCSLRNEHLSPEIAALIGPRNTERFKVADHMPSLVALTLADLLREARDELDLDRFAFLQIDRERALLIDHIGACERIVKTPLPKVYSIKVRRFIVLFLMTLPFALLYRLPSYWPIPLITMLVSYPLISLDQIGIELQNPFPKERLSHLPLEDISATIERNVLALLATRQGRLGSEEQDADSADRIGLARYS
jgi:ion channel-forming bestrophin family protein